MKGFQRPMLVSQNFVQGLSSDYDLGFLFISFIEVKLEKKIVLTLIYFYCVT